MHITNPTMNQQSNALLDSVIDGTTDESGTNALLSSQPAASGTNALLGSVIHDNQTRPKFDINSIKNVKLKKTEPQENNTEQTQQNNKAQKQPLSMGTNDDRNEINKN